jgi:hypothetical protein
LLAIRLTELDRGLGAQRLELSSRQTAMDAALAGQRQVELDIETARAQHVIASDAFSKTQAAYYAVQGEIARLEQALAHARELRERELRDLAQARVELSSVLVTVEHDSHALAEIDRDAGLRQPRAAEAEAAAMACYRPAVPWTPGRSSGIRSIWTSRSSSRLARLNRPGWSTSKLTRRGWIGSCSRSKGSACRFPWWISRPDWPRRTGCRQTPSS